jgi:hypothetical protein
MLIDKNRREVEEKEKRVKNTGYYVVLELRNKTINKLRSHLKESEILVSEMEDLMQEKMLINSRDS